MGAARRLSMADARYLARQAKALCCLRLDRTAHEAMHDFVHRQSFVEHLIDGLAERHFHFETLSHLARGFGGDVAFNDLADLSERGLRRAALGEQQAKTAVA